MTQVKVYLLKSYLITIKDSQDIKTITNISLWQLILYAFYQFFYSVHLYLAVIVKMAKICKKHSSCFVYSRSFANQNRADEI